MMPPRPDSPLLEETIFHGDDFPVRVARRHGKSATAHPRCTHLEMEIQFICQGQGFYFIRDRSYAFGKNSVLIIHRHEIHNSLAHPASSIKRLSLLFSPRVLHGRPASLAALESLANCYHTELPEKEATVAEFLLHEMMEECRHRSGAWQAITRNLLENLLLTIARAQVSAREAPHENPLVQQAIQYLESHYTARVTLAEVAEVVHCSPYSLSRSFKGYAGLGFKDYLIHRRIGEAKRLLAETPLKVVAIARRVGFDDLSTFNRDFKLLTGVSPSTYRRATR